MNLRDLLCILLLVAPLLAFGRSTPVADSAAAPQWKPLFNGKDLSGFKSEQAAAFWRIENGVLVG
ncbi:MAG: hypothetical protein QG602_1992, partial [Verrucomicrobiota bacterium]|nr:hypothetical protein [Verrucomicrobiota bacterium]